MDWTSFPAYNAGRYGYTRARQLVNSPEAQKAKINVRFTLLQLYGSLNYAKTRIANSGMRILQPAYASPNPDVRSTSQDLLDGAVFASMTTAGIIFVTCPDYFQAKSRHNFDAGTLTISAISLAASVLSSLATEARNQAFQKLLASSSKDDHFARDRFLCDSIEFGNARRIIGCAQILCDAKWEDLNLAVDLAVNTIHGARAMKPRHLRIVVFELDEIFHDKETHHPYKSKVESMIKILEEKLLISDGVQHF